MPATSTRNRILNCAEQLFAREGFNNTSLRVLTRKANVNLAAVNYHFGSKEALLNAVIERRLVPLNEQRRIRLEEVLAQARRSQTRPGVKALLVAFIQPTIEFRNADPAHADFIALIGRSWSDPDPTVRTSILQLVLPFIQYLFLCLQEALPQLPEEILWMRMQFLMGTMSFVMCRDLTFPQHIAGLPDSIDQEEQLRQLILFIRSGLEAQQ